MKFIRVLNYTSNPHVQEYKLLNVNHIMRMMPSKYDSKDLTAVIMTDGQQVLVNMTFESMVAAVRQEGWI